MGEGHSSCTVSPCAENSCKMLFSTCMCTREDCTSPFFPMFSRPASNWGLMSTTPCAPVRSSGST